jgi:hypothetical protein
VAIGGAVAIVVSLLVFPERAHGLGREAACRILKQISRDVDAVQIALAQNRLGDAVTKFQALAEEAKRERIVSIVRDPDPAPLARTLLRIRHDFVILSRATVEPFPDAVGRRLDPSLTQFSERATAFLRGGAAALADRSAPPPIAPTEAARSAYQVEIASIRNDGVERGLAAPDVERLFALGFGLEQLSRDLADLAQRVSENVRGSRSVTPS